MELVILFVVLALLIFGPRRGGRMPGPFAIIAGAILLLWLLFVVGVGSFFTWLLDSFAPR